MRDIFILIRPQQWIKNSFIFFPAFFAGLAFDSTLILRLLLGFFSFSFMASAVYVLNDFFDREYDKQHPKKKLRPIASGRIHPKKAFLIGFILFITALGTCLFIQPVLAGVTGLYFLLNLAYSYGLKHIPILDVVLISIGFVLRLVFGGYLAGVPLSNWILLVGFSLSLFLAFAKRRADFVLFVEEGKKTRKVLRYYNAQLINTGIYLSALATLISYIAYCLSPWTTHRFGWEIILTSLFVLLGLLRYFVLIFQKNKAANPTQVLYTDLAIQLCILGWVSSLVAVVFW